MPAPIIVYAVVTTATLATKLLKLKKFMPKDIKKGKAKSDECVKNIGVQKCSGGSKKSVSKLNPTKVPCFKKNSKGKPEEYDRQLENQQKGLNSMTADQYLEGRRAFSGVSCKDGNIVAAKNWSKEKDRPKRNAAAAKKARKKHEQKLVKQYKNQEMSTIKAKAAAAKEMKTLAALHNPDMVAAGKDIITSFGDRGINSSIGRQWQDRVGKMDKDMCRAKKQGKGNENMNVELKRCKKGK